MWRPLILLSDFVTISDFLKLCTSCLQFPGYDVLLLDSSAVIAELCSLIDPVNKIIWYS